MLRPLSKVLSIVIPVKLVLDSDRGTGIQVSLQRDWTPALAGVTAS